MLDPLIDQLLADQTYNPQLEAHLDVYADLQYATLVAVEISTGTLSFLLVTEICPSVETTVMAFFSLARHAGWTVQRGASRTNRGLFLRG